jgi:hypothetical protein
MDSRRTEGQVSTRRTGNSVRRIELRWLGSREAAVIGDGTPRFRAHPLEFDDRGLPVYQRPLTRDGQRNPW